MTTELFDPTAGQAGEEKIAWPGRPQDFQGLRVGLVENTKFNSEKILKKIATRLEREHGMSMVHLAHKQSAGHGVDETDIAEFKTKADFVIAGVGD